MSSLLHQSPSTLLHYILFHNSYPHVHNLDLLRRGQNLESMGNLLLPTHLRFPVDLSSWLEFLSVLPEKDGTSNDGVVSHDRLMVVNVGSAARAVVAVYCFA